MTGEGSLERGHVLGGGVSELGRGGEEFILRNWKKLGDQLPRRNSGVLSAPEKSPRAKSAGNRKGVRWGV